MTARVLVLDFNEKSKIATCFDINSKKTVKIRGIGGNGEFSRPRPQFIEYPKNANVHNQGEVLILSPSNCRIKDAEQEDCVENDNGYLKILDHKKKFGKSQLVSGFIAVNDLDYQKNNSLLFKVVSIEHNLEFAGEKKKVLRKLDDCEKKWAANGLANRFKKPICNVIQRHREPLTLASFL